MRPPAKQAENAPAPAPDTLGPAASMRPPAKQAENFRAGAEAGEVKRASMRPPAKQAENPSPPDRARRARSGRFNEAACKTGGKLVEVG